MNRTRLPRTGRKYTLVPLADEWVKLRIVRGEFAPRTARSIHYILHDLATYFGARPLNRLTTTAIDGWFEGMGIIAPTTRRIRLSAVTLFCRWLHATKRIKVDPMVDYPKVSLPRRVPVTVPEADVAKLLNLSNDRRMKVIVWLMVGMGCRCIEVSNLNIDDYDARAGTLKIVGKFGHERILPVIGPVADALDNYLDEIGRGGSGPLVRGRQPGTSGEATYHRLNTRTISTYVSKWMKAAGIKARIRDGKSAHGLRRTAASDVMDRTRDIHAVQAMLGHARIETTTIYLRPVSIDHLREAMEGRTYDPSPAA